MNAFSLLFFPTSLIVLLAASNSNLNHFPVEDYSIQSFLEQKNLIVLIVLLFAFSISSVSLRDHTVLEV